MANFPSMEINTINSLTLPKVSQKLADNITARIPLFYFLNKIGHKEYENGGLEYRLPVFVELANAQAYTGNTVLTNSERTGNVNTAIYYRKQISLDITLSGTNLLKNSGNDPTAVINYIAAQIEMAEESMKNSLAGTSIGILSDQGDSDLGITGLKTFLTDSTTTGTVGTLSRASYSWWRHKSDSVGTGFGTDGLASMRLLLLNVSRGDESPTIAIMTLTGYSLLLKAMTGTISYNTPSPATKFGDIGFEHINFFGTPVIYDDGMTSSRAFMLNLKYLKLLVHRDRDMSIRDFITPTNEDSIVGRIYWAGNLVCNNLARQGILQGLVDTDA